MKGTVYLHGRWQTALRIGESSRHLLNQSFKKIKKWQECFLKKAFGDSVQHCKRHYFLLHEFSICCLSEKNDNMRLWETKSSSSLAFHWRVGGRYTKWWGTSFKLPRKLVRHFVINPPKGACASRPNLSRYPWPLQSQSKQMFVKNFYFIVEEYSELPNNIMLI